MADNGKNDGPKLSPTQNIIILGGGFLLTAIVSMSFDLELSGIIRAFSPLINLSNIFLLPKRFLHQ